MLHKLFTGFKRGWLYLHAFLLLVRAYLADMRGLYWYAELLEKRALFIARRRIRL